MAVLQFHSASCEPVVNGAMLKREHLLPGNVTKFIPKSGFPYYAPKRDSSLGANKIYEQLLISSTCARSRLRAAKGDRFLFRADTECGLRFSGTLPDRAQFIDSRLQLPPAQFFRTLGHTTKRKRKQNQDERKMGSVQTHNCRHCHKVCSSSHRK